MLKRFIIKNTAINGLGKALNYILQLLIIALAIRELGAERYGVFVLALTIVSSTNLLEAGFGLAITKYVAEWDAKGDTLILNRIVNTGLLINAFLALIFFTVIFFVNKLFLGVFFRIPSELLPEAKILVNLLLLLSLVDFWNIGLIRVLEGFQDFFLARLMENTKWLLRLTFLVVLFFVVEKSLFFVGISYLMAGILSFFFLFWGVFFRHHVQFNLLFFNFEEAKRIFRFSGWLLFSKMSAFVLYRMNVLVIGIFLEPVYLTYYNLAFKIYEPVKYGLSILSSTLVSVASRLSVMSDIKRITNLFKKSTYYMIAIMLPVITFVFFQAGNIINIWMGENYGVSIRLLKLFMISIIPLTLTVSGTEMLLGLDKFKFLVIYGCLGAAMSFLINLVFISFIGLDATLYGLILGSSLSSAGYLRVVIKNFDIRLMQFLKNLPYKSLLFAFVLVFLFASVKNLYFDITFLACYYLMFFFFFMDVSDRKDIISIIKP